MTLLSQNDASLGGRRGLEIGQRRSPQKPLTARATIIVVLVATTCLAQAGGTAKASATTETAAHATLLVQLSKSLDSRKLKPGAPVSVVLLNDVSRVRDEIIPHGSVVLGHVTEASVRSNATSKATLGIVFDRVQVHKGGETLLHGAILALAPDPDASMTTPSALNYPDRTEEIYKKPNVTKPTGVTVPLLNEQSCGVYGAKDLQLGPDGLLVSDKNEVKVSAGTRILISATMP